MAQTTFSGPVKSDNGFLAPAYTLTTLPTASAGLVIYVSNANSGVGTIAFGNGSVFIDIKTGLQVA